MNRAAPPGPSAPPAPTGFADLLAPLNEAITPLVKAGVAAPFVNPFGLVVLEIPGRKTGLPYTLPLACWSFHNTVVVSTVRSGSQWLRNLAAAESVTIWLRGRRRLATATVIVDGNVTSADEQQPELLLQPLRDVSQVLGLSVAVLSVQ